MKPINSSPNPLPANSPERRQTLGTSKTTDLHPAGRALCLAVLAALFLGAASSVQGAALNGPVYPPPGGVVWTDESPGEPDAGGKTGGKDWSYSDMPLAAQTLTYWGPSSTNEIALSFTNQNYTAEELMDFAPGLSDLSQGRAVWTGQTWMPPGLNGWLEVGHVGLATQSTTDADFVASNALDSLTNTFTRTSSSGDPTPWWQVDLGAEVSIVRIFVGKQLGASAEPLTGITVRILAADGQTNWTSALLSAGSLVGHIEVTPPASTVGQIVKVSRNIAVLALSEVEVFTMPIPLHTRFTMNVTNLADGLPLSLTNAVSVGLNPNVGALVRVTPGLEFRANMIYEAAIDPDAPFNPAFEVLSTLGHSSKLPHGTQAYSTFNAGFYYYDQTLPTIDAISNQITGRDTPSGPHLFSVGDSETPLEELVVTASSDNQTLVPDQNILLGGTGAGREILVTPATGEGGTCTITLRVDDGFGFATTSFVLTVDDPPTLSGIPDQFIQQDGSTGPLPFTIGDTETPAAGLSVQAYSGNPVLVPPPGLELNGNDAERTLTVTPAPGQAGQALITISVSDAAQTISTTFLLTVNGRPSITDLPDLFLQQDTSTEPLSLTIGDFETAAADLTLVSQSSNTDLLPLENIVFGGSEASRTVTLTPAPGQHGLTTVGIGVADGSITNYDTFVLTVNGRPTISAVPDQVTQRDQATQPIPFVIGDPETPADQLVLTASSSDAQLVPQANITLGGAGTDRTITLSPERGKSGIATITLSVADATITNSHSFQLKVNSQPLLVANNPLTVQRGGSGTLTTQLLLTTDVESGPTNLVYTVAPENQGSPPHNGALYLNGVLIEPDDTFTQDDIDRGRVTYTHDGQCGTDDDFTFKVTDPDEGVTPVQPGAYGFKFQIEHPNVTPVTIDGEGVIPLGTLFQGVLGVLNDDCVPQTLLFRLVTDPANGTVTLDDPNTGAFSYSPNAGFAGQDSFTFQVNDGFVDADAPGTFMLTVANQAPVTEDGQGTTQEDTAFDGQFIASDPDLPPQDLTFVIVSQPPKGNVVVTDAGLGAFRYTPNAGAIGQDAFTFRVTDGLTNSETRTFTLEIRPRLDAGDLLVTDLDSRSLVLIDPSGEQVLISSTDLIDSPEGLAVEAQGTIVLKDKTAGLIRVNVTDGSQTLVSPATNFAQEDVQAFSLAVEADGSILVPDGPQGLVRVNPITGAPSVLSAGDPFVYPRGVAVAPDGTIYVADLSGFQGQPSRVIQVDPVSGAATVVATSDLLVLPTTLTLDQQGMLIVADAGSFAGAVDMVIRIDPATGAQTQVTANDLLNIPTGLAVASDGTILTLNSQGLSIVKIDPLTGAQSTFSSGGLLTSPLGLAMVPQPSSQLHLTLVQATPQVVVQLQATLGSTYELQRSTDLLSWSQVDTQTAASDGLLDLRDSNPPAGRAFYQAFKR